MYQCAFVLNAEGIVVKLNIIAVCLVALLSGCVGMPYPPYMGPNPYAGPNIWNGSCASAACRAYFYGIRPDSSPGNGKNGPNPYQSGGVSGSVAVSPDYAWINPDGSTSRIDVPFGERFPPKGTKCRTGRKVRDSKGKVIPAYFCVLPDGRTILDFVLHARNRNLQEAMERTREQQTTTAPAGTNASSQGIPGGDEVDD